MVWDPKSGKYRRTRLFVMTLGFSRKAARLLSFKKRLRRSRIWCEMSAHTGVLVTSVGYTAGALKRAQSEEWNIELDILTPAEFAQFQAVELRLGENRGCLAQNLIGALQFANLPLQLLHPLSLVRRQPRAPSRISLDLADPLTQRLRRTADLGCDRPHCRPLRFVPALVLEYHPHCPLTNFR